MLFAQNSDRILPKTNSANRDLPELILHYFYFHSSWISRVAFDAFLTCSACPPELLLSLASYSGQYLSYKGSNSLLIIVCLALSVAII